MINDVIFFFFKQKTAYELRISDCSSDVCSSDLQKLGAERLQLRATRTVMQAGDAAQQGIAGRRPDRTGALPLLEQREYPAIAVRPAQFGDHRQIGRASCRERV